MMWKDEDINYYAMILLVPLVWLVAISFIFYADRVLWIAQNGHAVSNHNTMQ